MAQHCKYGIIEGLNKITKPKECQLGPWEPAHNINPMLLCMRNRTRFFYPKKMEPGSFKSRFFGPGPVLKKTGSYNRFFIFKGTVFYRVNRLKPVPLYLKPEPNNTDFQYFKDPEPGKNQTGSY